MFHHSKQGAVDVITGESPLQGSSIDSLKVIVENCVAAGQPRIVLDLSEISLIDSSGLDYLLDVRDQCIQRGGQLRLAAPNDLCRDILEVGEVAEALEICGNVTSAVGGFAR